MKEKRASQFYNSSVEKAIKIVETMSNNDKSYIGISEISRLSKLDKSSVYRIINTLYDLGYLVKNSSSNYGLSSKFVVLTNKILSKMTTLEAIEQYLKKISVFTNHFTTFSIIESNKAILVKKIDSGNTLRIHSEIGKTYPLNCSAAGKAYLSILNNVEIDKLYSEIELVKMTDNSIVDIDKLKIELEAIRKRGYAVNNEEHDLYRVSIAVPVYNINSTFIGCIGLSLPSMIAEKEKVNKYGEYIKKISVEIKNNIV